MQEMRLQTMWVWSSYVLGFEPLLTVESEGGPGMHCLYDSYLVQWV